MTDVLYSSTPPDLPSALAMAKWVESNHGRYAFAVNFAKSLEDKTNRQDQRP